MGGGGGGGGEGGVLPSRGVFVPEFLRKITNDLPGGYSPVPLPPSGFANKNDTTENVVRKPWADPEGRTGAPDQPPGKSQVAIGFLKISGTDPLEDGPYGPSVFRTILMEFSASAHDNNPPKG